MNNSGILILAAGSSSRLGRPKQLLAFQQKSLLAHVAAEARKANLSPITIVTGAYQDDVIDALQNEAVNILYNKNWEQGMGSSIVAGITGLTTIHASLENLVIAVCDQPFVSASLFIKMMEAGRETGKGIVACAYSGTLGVPVMFSRKYFDLLLGLKGEEGAKKLVQLYLDDVAEVPFSKGDIDIDTEEQYERIVSDER